jgi:hypothetical protein
MWHCFQNIARENGSAIGAVSPKYLLPAGWPDLLIFAVWENVHILGTNNNTYMFKWTLTWGLFFLRKSRVLIFIKMCCATVWPIFHKVIGSPWLQGCTCTRLESSTWRASSVVLSRNIRQRYINMYSYGNQTLTSKLKKNFEVYPLSDSEYSFSFGSLALVKRCTKEVMLVLLS